MKSFFFTLSFLFILLNLEAQHVKWARHKAMGGSESYEKTTFIYSTSQPFVVNHMDVMHTGTLAPHDQFIIANDTSGTELWVKKKDNLNGSLLTPVVVS